MPHLSWLSTTSRAAHHACRLHLLIPPLTGTQCAPKSSAVPATLLFLEHRLLFTIAPARVSCALLFPSSSTLSWRFVLSVPRARLTPAAVILTATQPTSWVKTCFADTASCTHLVTTARCLGAALYSLCPHIRCRRGAIRLHRVSLQPLPPMFSIILILHLLLFIAVPIISF